MTKVRDFFERAKSAANDMTVTDRKHIAAILEDFERRLRDLEKATDPHRMAGYD